MIPQCRSRLSLYGVRDTVIDNVRTDRAAFESEIMLKAVDSRYDAIRSVITMNTVTCESHTEALKLQNEDQNMR